MRWGETYFKSISIKTAIVCVFLCLPILLSFLNLSPAPLHGVTEKDENIGPSLKEWWNGDFQRSVDEKLNRRFGLFEYYVRVYNQIDFDFFKKANARYVVVGKDNCLYESGYIDALNGKELVDRIVLISKLKKLKAAQVEMLKQGKLLLPIVAPGKASFYPEYIPDRYIKDKNISNYDLYKSALTSLGIEWIDFRAHFLASKSKSPYPLYPKGGIHWSNYASVVCFDSIMQFVGEKLNQDLPTIEIKGVEWSERPRYPDDDIAKGLNLLWPLPAERMAYPVFSINDSAKVKLKLLTVADSFWWYLYSSGIPSGCFSENRFWYYNETMYPESDAGDRLVKESNFYYHIRQADVILVLYNESNLHRYSDGFVEMCYETFCKPNIMLEELQSIRSNIRSSAEWYSKIVMKAKENNISVDSMLTLDAIYVMQLNKKPR